MLLFSKGVEVEKGVEGEIAADRESLETLVLTLTS